MCAAGVANDRMESITVVICSRLLGVVGVIAATTAAFNFASTSLFYFSKAANFAATSSGSTLGSGLGQPNWQIPWTRVLLQSISSHLLFHELVS